MSLELIEVAKLEAQLLAQQAEAPLELYREHALGEYATLKTADDQRVQAELDKPLSEAELLGEFVGDVVSLFPKATMHLRHAPYKGPVSRLEFETADTIQAENLISSIVWLSSGNSLRGENTWPHLVIGGNAKETLLVPVQPQLEDEMAPTEGYPSLVEDAERIMSLDWASRSKGAIRKFRNATKLNKSSRLSTDKADFPKPALTKSYKLNFETINEARDNETGIFHIDNKSEGSFEESVYAKSALLYEDRRNDERPSGITKVTATDMNAFNVFHHLSVLTKKFDKHDQYMALLKGLQAALPEYAAGTEPDVTAMGLLAARLGIDAATKETKQ